MKIDINKLRNLYTYENLTKIDKIIETNKLYVFNKTLKIFGVFYYLVNKEAPFAVKKIEDILSKEIFKKLFYNLFEKLILAAKNQDVSLANNVIEQIDLIVLEQITPSILEKTKNEKLAKKSGIKKDTSTKSVYEFIKSNRLYTFKYERNPSFSRHSYKLDDRFLKFTFYSSIEKIPHFIREKFNNIKIRESWISTFLIYKNVSTNLERLSLDHFHKSYHLLTDDETKVLTKTCNVKYLINPSLSFDILRQKEQKQLLSFEELKTSLESINKFDYETISDNIRNSFITKNLFIPKDKPYKFESSVVRNLFRLSDLIDEYIEENSIFGLNLSMILDNIIENNYFNDDPKSLYKIDNSIFKIFNDLMKIDGKYKNIATYNFKHIDILSRLEFKKNSDNTNRTTLVEETERTLNLASINLLNHNVNESNTFLKLTSQFTEDNKTSYDLILASLIKLEHDNPLKVLNILLSKLNENGYVIVLAKQHLIDNQDKANEIGQTMKHNNISLSHLILTRCNMRHDKVIDDYKPYVIYMFFKHKRQSVSFKFINLEKMDKNLFSNILNLKLEDNLYENIFDNKFREYLIEKEYREDSLIPATHLPIIKFEF